MKRLAIAIFVSLLAMALLAPASVGTTVKHRFWQDLSLSGPFAGRITLAIAFEDTKGNRLFKPRYASAYELKVQTSCDAPGDPWHKFNADAFPSSGFGPYFNPPLHNGRFDHRFENEYAPLEGPVHGDLTGKLVWRGKWVKRVTGSFDVEVTGTSGPPPTSSCTSLGSYDATRCKSPRYKRDRPEWWRRWKVPVCRDYPF